MGNHTLSHATIWDAVSEEAEKAYARDEVPVGAVITYRNTIVARAYNLTETQHNPLAHAECLALAEAHRVLGAKYLLECDLYVSLEPCTMCAGAISHSKIRRLYYGAYDAKAGAVDSGVRFFTQSSCHHAPDVYGGINESTYATLLKSFFAQKRG